MIKCLPAVQKALALRPETIREVGEGESLMVEKLQNATSNNLADGSNSPVIIRSWGELEHGCSSPPDHPLILLGDS